MKTHHHSIKLISLNILKFQVKVNWSMDFKRISPTQVKLQKIGPKFEPAKTQKYARSLVKLSMRDKKK